MNVKEILKKELDKIKLSEEDYKDIEKKTSEFKANLEKQLKKRKIKADVFVGGSLAKKTIMKKDKYDVDVFVRFNDNYKDSEISDLAGKCLSQAERVHGSRDYFKIKKDNLIFEVVPVTKISSAKHARNVTDLSFFHVSYVKKALKKNKKLGDEIILAKAFCYANNFYGAESYIQGFSGYALELLMIKYKNLTNFLKAIVKDDKQIILDPEKYYKNKDDIMTNLNEAKLVSPVIFIDPTFKERNALAALSFETLSKFREKAKKFLDMPSLAFFEVKIINENNYNLILEAETNKQEGDIAGSKLLKYFNYLSRIIDKYFMIEKKDFSYEGKNAKFYFKIKARKEIILNGPRINDVQNVVKFKNKHKNVFIKDERTYAREKVDIKIKDLLNSKENKKVRKDMGITSLD